MNGYGMENEKKNTYDSQIFYYILKSNQHKAQINK